MDTHCNGCEQKDRCAEIYKKVGHSEGPNVAFKAITAFVVPIVMFVAAALIAQFFLKNRIANSKLMVLIQLAAGLAAAAVMVFIVRRLTRKNCSEPIECPEKENH